MVEHLDMLVRFAQFVLWAALAFFTWQSNRHRATQEQVLAVDARVHELSEEVTRLEERVRHVPTEASFQMLGGQLAKLEGTLMGMRESLETTRRQCERLEDYLRDSRGRS